MLNILLFIFLVLHILVNFDLILWYETRVHELGEIVYYLISSLSIISTVSLIVALLLYFNPHSYMSTRFNSLPRYLGCLWWLQTVCLLLATALDIMPSFQETAFIPNQCAHSDWLISYALLCQLTRGKIARLLNCYIKSHRPQVSMVKGMINHLGCWNLEGHSKNS